MDPKELERIERYIKYSDERKKVAQERIKETKYSSKGLYFGLLGLSLDKEYIEFDFGRIQKVNEHAGAVEFASALKKPWLFMHVAQFAEHINFELFLNLENSNIQTQLNLAWDFLALLKVKTCADFIVPIALNYSWSVIPALENNSVEVYTLDDFNKYLILSNEKTRISESDINWVIKNLISFMDLAENKNINHVIQCITNLNYQPSLQLTIPLLWSGIESIFGIQSEISFRLSTVIAFFLKKRGEERYKLYKEIKELYNIRSKLVHGNGIKDISLIEHVNKTRKLLSEILIKIIEEGKLPSKSDFEKNIFI